MRSLRTTTRCLKPGPQMKEPSSSDRDDVMVIDQSYLHAKTAWIHRIGTTHTLTGLTQEQRDLDALIFRGSDHIFTA